MRNITNYSLLRITGEKAATFLQGQLTCDVLKLSEKDTQLGAFCNYQGRVLATFWLILQDGLFYMILPEEVVEATREVLHKYAVFSKVAIENVTDDFAIKAEVSPAVKFHLSPPNEGEIDAEFKQQLIEAEIPMIYSPTIAHFTPHMLNLPALGAVSFDKGCYVGQEIVARTEYRGTVKRRLQKFSGEEKLSLEIGEKTPAQDGDVVSYYHPDSGGTVYLAVASVIGVEGV